MARFDRLVPNEKERDALLARAVRRLFSSSFCLIAKSPCSTMSWKEDELKSIVAPSLGKRFKAGNFDIEDEPRSGRPTEVDCETLKQIIDQNRNVSTRTIALELDVCQETIVNVLKRIILTFKFNRWVPHELTAKDKRKRKAACLALLRDQRKETILGRIVTCDEKWCTTAIQAVKEGGQHLGNQ
ncbi:Histone-lysine N-methyltransferase SETMAR [Araneus ventricosus]|uniref:Histone-lysine N-methyltransferase SETMAR n=1 Tax=Araneus ventricosus TaxID=182803 RepID=A0A4Y2IT88_ARAVE|nr:Histone-lysine N-methyltransferase SETMAR [Araneus ventricosus]